MNIPPILVIERIIRDAGIPIDGVSIGNPNDRSTWRIFYQPSATAPQRTQGDGLLQTLDPQDTAVVTALKQDLSTTKLSDEAIRAIVQGLFEAIPAPTMTLVQLRNRILAIYRGLI